uniref:Ras-GEF domain-containing protein n=1 Tax=Steinernema glaseri TaxID=37863 RepID=A0A1I8A7T7_9BILA
MAESYEHERWLELEDIICNFLNSNYGKSVNKQTMFTEFISLFEREIHVFILAEICVPVAQYITRGRRCTRRGITAGLDFLMARMAVCWHSAEASLMLRVAWLEMCAYGDPYFSQDQLNVIFDHIRTLRRSVALLPESFMKGTISIHFHTLSTGIAWGADRYRTAYQHLNIFCEDLLYHLYSYNASKEYRERTEQSWAKRLAISALFADNITDFDPVLYHIIMEPIRLRRVLLIFTNCNVVNFCKFKKFHARILPWIRRANLIPPIFSLGLIEGKMKLLEEKFRSIAARKIAASDNMLTAEAVNRHVEKFMENTEKYVDKMPKEFDKNWVKIFWRESSE